VKTVAEPSQERKRAATGDRNRRGATRDSQPNYRDSSKDLKISRRREIVGLANIQDLLKQKRRQGRDGEDPDKQILTKNAARDNRQEKKFGEDRAGGSGGGLLRSGDSEIFIAKGGKSKKDAKY